MASSRKPLGLSRFNKHINRRNWFFAAAVLIGIAAAIPLISQSGFLNTRGGGDSPFLLQRLQQLMAALNGGHFPVRWMPDANFGYGYPFYNYYAPLSIYIAAFFRFLGLSYVLAIKAAQLSGFIVASLTMYWLVRRWFHDEWAGLLGAAAYTFAPFHMVNVYVRGDSLAEFWAMALFPVVILALDRAISKIRATAHLDQMYVATGEPRLNLASRRALALLALAAAALVLTHNISALIFAPFILLYIASTFLKDPRLPSADNKIYLKSIGLPLVALLLSLALSAWFWLPALAERDLAQMGPITSGYFHFSNHFRSFDLVQWKAIFSYDVAGGEAFKMGFVQLAATLSGLVALLLQGAKPQKDSTDARASSQARTGLIVFIGVGLIGATLMITPYSRVLWEYVPLLPYVQFPWRFLSIQAFFAALATAGLAFLPKHQWISPIVILLLMGSAIIGMKLDFLQLADDDVSAERVAQYEWFTGNIGTTVSAEYLPSSITPRPYTSNWLNTGKRDTNQVLAGSISEIDNIERKPSRQRWQASVDSPSAEVTLPTIDWPNWEASSDRGQTTTTSASGSGLIALGVTEEVKEIFLGLKRTPARWAGELISLTALMITVALLRPKRPESRHLKIAVAIILLLLASVLMIRLWPERHYEAGDLTWDFDQMAYLHHDTDGATFENGAILESYHYSQDEVEAGEDITITIEWDSPSAEEVTLALVTPAVNRFSFAPVLFSKTLPIIDEKTTFQVEIPADSPAGLYLPRITFDDAQVLTPSGQTRGDLFMRPFRILDQLELADPPNRSLDVRADQIRRVGNALDVHLQWATGSPLTQNYGFSLRLVDQDGREVALFDNQPGFGYLPSSLWPAGQWIDDWLAIPLPEGIPNDKELASLALVIRLYDVSSGEVLLTKRLGQINQQQDALSLEPVSGMLSLPAEAIPIRANFGDPLPLVGLRGYDLDQTEDYVKLTLYWQSLSADLPDYTHFVHLIDPNSGEIVNQHDTMPQNDSYPTSQWLEGEYVADPALIDLTTLPAGEYELVVGLYQNLGSSFPRLPISDGESNILDGDALRLPVTIVSNGN